MPHLCRFLNDSQSVHGSAPATCSHCSGGVPANWERNGVGQQEPEKLDGEQANYIQCGAPVDVMSVG